MKGKRIEYEKVFALLVLSASCLFNFYLCQELLGEGAIDAGDDQYHLTMSKYVYRLITEEKSLFGVYHAYGTGYPWLLPHQSLLYVAVSIVHLLSLGSISLLLSHNLTIVCLFSLYPVGYYYLFEKFGAKPLHAAIASCFSVIPISGWGNTVTAYFTIGLSSQLPGAFLFPFALGSFHELLTKGGAKKKVAILYSLTLFGHPYAAFFLALVSVLDVLVYLPKRLSPDVKERILGVFKAGVLTFLVVSFWVLGVSTALNYAPRNIFMVASRSSFSLNEALEHYVSGQLLDVSDNFGEPHGKSLRWPVNEESGRLPVLTFFSMLGLVLGFRFDRRFALFCLLGLVLAFMLLVGKDDLPFLEFLPLSEHSNAKRAIYLFDFFSVCLASNALYVLIAHVRDYLKGRFRAFYTLPFYVMVLALVFYTPFVERAETADKTVKLIDYWFTDFGQLGRYMRSSGADVRVFGEAETGVVSAPVILSEPFHFEMPVLRRIYATRFFGDLLEYPNLLGLFHIGYVLTSSSYEIPNASSQHLDKVYSTNVYDLYEVSSESEWLGVSHKRPALVLSHEKGWRRLAEVWLSYYKKTEHPETSPLLVNYEGQKIDYEDYCCMLEYERKKPSLTSIFSNSTYDAFALPHHSVRSVLYDRFESEPKAQVEVLTRSVHEVTAKVTVEEDALVYYKVKYHPNWGAKVDGVDVTCLRVSPEYMGAFVGQGSHIVQFSYELSLFDKLLRIVGALTLTYLLGVHKIFSKLRNKKIHVRVI